MVLRLLPCVITTMLVGAVVARAADPLPADLSFVRRSEQSANQQSADAQRALTESKNSAVQAVAKDLRSDGDGENQRLATLSVDKGWPTPDLNPPDAIDRYSDASYVSREIREQRAAIDSYAEEAANGADTDLQEFARRMLPTLQKRLDALRALRTS